MAVRSRRAVGWLVVGVFVAGALGILGLVAFWPRGEAPELGAQPNNYVDATVTGVDEDTCPDIEVDVPTPCQIVTAQLTSGPDEGGIIEFQVRSTQFDVPPLGAGDQVVLLDIPTSPAEFRYSFADFQRQTPLIWLGVAFVAVVVAFGRWQGVRALIGLVGSGFVLIAFVVPALLRDQPALPVALAGTVVIAFLALYLAHGFKVSTTVALAGSLIALALTAVGAFVVAGAAELTGLSDQNAQVLRVTAASLDLRGLLIAGIVVGALGVLDDVTVSQVSTVSALRRANPGLAPRLLYLEAVRVGRDHVAATVNTLVLAYAGASLPLILFFTQGSQPVGRLITSELIAVEIVRMLVGSIGLVASVPITTALAAMVLGPGDDIHGHSHHDRAPVPVGAGSSPAMAAGDEPGSRETERDERDTRGARGTRGRRRRRVTTSGDAQRDDPTWDDFQPSEWPW
jgi:uncharacterized membrane protein